MKYNLLVKTGEAEIRALVEADTQKYINQLFPIIEITRGRKSKNDSEGNIEKRLIKLHEVFKGYTVILDATTVEDLLNSEISGFYDQNSGYKNWIDFLSTQKSKFTNIIPTILVDDFDKDNFEDNLLSQVKTLQNEYSEVCYRFYVEDDGVLDDLQLLKDNGINLSKINIVIDCGFMRPSAWKGFSKAVLSKIKKILDIGNVAKIIIVSTTFPKIVADFGNDDEDVFLLDEIKLYDSIKSELDNDGIDSGFFEYGDYGTINPERNDGFATAWVPRVDVPLQDRIYYKRTRREGKAYRDAYIKSALKAVNDKRFPNSIECWGIKSIRDASLGDPEGSNPAFWISVRMNIHLVQQIKRLFSI